MYLLPCPECQETIPVSPSHAGDETKCQSCNAVVAIPKLGVLRGLPLAEASQATPDVADRGGTRMAVAALGLIALIMLFSAGFATVRWALIDVPTNTEDHISHTKKEYETLDAARLIREYEHMEEASLDMPAKFVYKTKELEKRGWGIRALIAGSICLVCGVGTIKLASSGRTS